MRGFESSLLTESLHMDEKQLAEFEQRLTEAGGRINPLLHELFPAGDKDYISRPFWHHMESGGKRVRPALCLMCCEHLGGDSDAALPFAAAVELLHNMLLIHDDLEDGDAIRRDKPTVWKQFGQGNAINVGDYMLGRAYSAILRCPVDDTKLRQLISAFTRAYEHTCAGQALDLNCRGSKDFTVSDYLKMVELKTGDYLALGMVGGALIAGMRPEETQPIRELGSNMGPAFQIRDDIIDLTKGKGRGGEIGNDIREGKPSILYAHSLNVAEPEMKAKLLEIIRKPRAETKTHDVETVLEVYRSTGSIEFAQKKANQLVEEAFATLESIPIKDSAFFQQVARFMAERTR